MTRLQALTLARAHLLQYYRPGAFCVDEHGNPLPPGTKKTAYTGLAGSIHHVCSPPKHATTISTALDIVREAIEYCKLGLTITVWDSKEPSLEEVIQVVDVAISLSTKKTKEEDQFNISTKPGTNSGSRTKRTQLAA